MSTIKIVIVGAAGRMGRTLVRQVSQTPGCGVSGATEPAGSEFLGRDAGLLAGIDALGVAITDDPLQLIAGANAVLDFTSPAAAASHAALCAQARIVHVIGATGFEPEQEAAIAAAARHATIIKAGNMSLGVNLLAQLVRQAAKILDSAFDIEILEMHHRHKVDAPSGTALLLGEAAAEGRGVKLADAAVRGRDGITGARKAGDIGFAVLRGGGVVGDHSVLFAADDEIIELRHQAFDRSIFARGAVAAARWGQGKKPGLYSMADVLGFGG
ncbi:MAG TPA: 4-hydroxy-tetrahydrodipicolinate reductase [Alphaproteobacteria bacterium]|nr:4-hydroxy-tetrahydrodipicolinate reductase [Alphaproteobacteria bacterium]